MVFFFKWNYWALRFFLTLRIVLYPSDCCHLIVYSPFNPRITHLDLLISPSLSSAVKWPEDVFCHVSSFSKFDAIVNSVLIFSFEKRLTSLAWFWMWITIIVPCCETELWCVTALGDMQTWSSMCVPSHLGGTQICLKPICSILELHEEERGLSVVQSAFLCNLGLLQSCLLFFLDITS